MAIGDISLTSGMRANLQALQNTSNAMDNVQRRLSTGKKVNSALDNPTNFFAAQAHNNRARDLDSLKDGMSEAVQVIKAADEGISSVTAMIEAAKGLAQAAQTATNDKSGTVTIEATSTFTTGDTITINGETFTAISASGGAASANGFCITDADGNGITGSAALASLVSAIALNTTLADVVTADDDTDGTVTLEADDGTYFTGVSDTGANVTATAAVDRGERYDLAQQYETLMAQLDTLVDDADYKGDDTNLLLSTASLEVSFEGTHTLSIDGFSAKTADLGGGITDATNDWAAFSDITGDITKMDEALATLRTEAKGLASNLTVITTRQDFTTSMINTLTDGADNLTLADMNEEGANMLMLQTQQQLATTSLSMSSQAAQAVLRLF